MPDLFALYRTRRRRAAVLADELAELVAAGLLAVDAAGRYTVTDAGSAACAAYDAQRGEDEWTSTSSRR